jgi:hypothetical protein
MMMIIIMMQADVVDLFSVINFVQSCSTLFSSIAESAAKTKQQQLLLI